MERGGMERGRGEGWRREELHNQPTRLRPREKQTLGKPLQRGETAVSQLGKVRSTH